ncbi:MAG: phosphatidate cytidylyltransferase [Acidobacteriota bacterium]|nr:MAG: phosphatidate cytidylyltransferase [Acidobacteriota bacterium]
MRRLVTAAVTVPLLLLVILRGPAWLFLVLALLFGLAGFWELSKMLTRSDKALLPIGYPVTGLLIASFYFQRLPFVHASLIALLLIGFGVVMNQRPDRDNLVAATGTVFATFYVGALLGSLVGLRMVEPDPAGPRWVVFLMTVVFVGDAGAYYVGKSLGKHTLAPRLSPKKTMEGLAGDVVFATAMALVLNELWFPGLPVATVAGLGVMLSLVGVGGDLFESFLKRSADVKDTSSLIPGHGGVLDRVDSVLFAAPALLMCIWWL